MKWRVLKTVYATVLASVLMTPAFCQNYYLVIGAFATENDDIKEFTSYLPGQNFDTAYTINSNNQLMHFYVLKTSNKDLAIAGSQKLQTEIENLNEKKPRNPSDEFTLTARGPLGNNNPPMNGAEMINASSPKAGSGIPSSGGSPMKPKGQYFKFTIASEKGTPFNGEVHNVDLLKGRELASFKADTYIDLLPPGKGQPLTMVCGVFGYKEVEKYIDYSNPSLTDGAYQDDQGAWIIPYTLERLESGDVSVMYNVSFYKDAVVMLPGSKSNLDELLEMMKLNPNYVIKVHAHCNGKNSRKIIALGKNNNFFDVKGSVEKRGSAKELTNLRGEAVKSYLMEHGINEDRIKCYGWGGSEMLVDKNNPKAKLNDRIEIEILKD